MRIFISHSSKDAELAAKVCRKIEAAGHSCFLAPRDIRSGYEYAEEIINGIDSTDIVLLLLSQAANDSPHVLREIERAVSNNKSVIVYKLEEVKLSKSMEYFLMTRQWLASNGKDDFFDIIQRLNEYADAHNMPADSVNTPAETVPYKKENSSLRKGIILIWAALIIAAGVIIAVCLANGTPQNASGNIPQTPAASEGDIVSEASSTEAQSSLTPQANSSSDNTRSDLPQESSDADSSADDSSSAETIESPPQTEPVSATTPQQTSAEPSQEVPVTEDAVKAELGDSLLFGTYNGEPIKWRVLRISEDKTKAVVIANDIITMKAYDAAEGGKYNEYDGKDYWTVKLSEIPAEVQRQIRGDNRWELSNIRTWLNSARENVVYSDQAPTPQAMSEKQNGYHTEVGFLNGFGKAELDAIAETEITTNGAVTTDKVFLLSSSELEWLDEADVSIFAKPTAAAVEQDKSGWYSVYRNDYGVDDFFWWLRDANPENSCECYYINISYSDLRVTSRSVGLEGFGIRPAITLDLTSDTVKKALENQNETD